MLERLFSPVRIRNLELKNRIAMPPFGLNFTGVKRLPNDRLVDFYEERARGGAGLLIVGGVGVDLNGSGLMLPSIESDDSITHWSRLSQAVHRHGARLFLQLFHSGRYSHSSLAGGRQALAPSAVPSRYTGETPRALTLEEIPIIQDQFVQAARRAVEAGVDGVEIIASAGYLICQFMSPLTNLREDAYGGSEENRARFGVEVLTQVRAMVGDGVPVTLRLSGNEFMEGGNGSAEILSFARRFEAAGADAFNVTGGWHETLVPQLPSMVPPGAYSYLAAAIKREVSVPVFASNRIVHPEQAEALLANGVCDIVSVGRSLIADPEWPRKALEERGAQIRPCVGCMQGCLDRLFTMKSVECLCNPRAGYEAKRTVTPGEKPGHVVVVGAGAAGMEAALTAEARGFKVTLLEKSREVGGQIPVVAAPPGRGDFLRLLDYYRGELARSNVELRTGIDVTPAMLAELKAEAIILATGSTPVVPPIPGRELPHVVGAWDVLQGKVVPGRRVAVVGGGAVGIETALFVAEMGTMDAETVKFLLKHGGEPADRLKNLMTRSPRSVTIIEQEARIGKGVGKSTRWVFFKELELYGVEILTGTRVESILPSGLRTMAEGGARDWDVDTVIVAVGSRSENRLSAELKHAGIEHRVVGDASSPRTLLEAIHEGFLAAVSL